MNAKGNSIDVEHYINAAAQHGEDSEPDHEVGDLQEFLRAAWNLMSADQRVKFSMLESVRDTMYGATGEEAFISRVDDVAGSVKVEEEDWLAAVPKNTEAWGFTEYGKDGKRAAKELSAKFETLLRAAREAIAAGADKMDQAGEVRNVMYREMHRILAGKERGSEPEDILLRAIERALDLDCELGRTSGYSPGPKP